MNVIRVCGGLGNQLFQYAFGRLQKRLGHTVLYDIDWYEKHQDSQWPRNYCLDKFNVFTRIGKHNGGQKTVKDITFDARIPSLSNRYFVGYWQYLDYYKGILSALRTELVLRHEVYTEKYKQLKQLITEKESVAVHVRRGDYITHSIFGPMPLDYYFKALTYVPNARIFIFSDEIDYCKRLFKEHYFSREMIFVSNEDYIDFELMRLCTHQIISRSTFSWWAALLNETPGKRVICPERFIVKEIDALTYNNKIHYPGDWIKI
jgi:hypothetical protein